MWHIWRTGHITHINATHHTYDKPAKMAEKWPRFGGPRSSWELAWTMNRVDWLRTSTDKRMWSGRRAVVMVRWAAVGCGCSALIRRFSWTGDWGADHEGYPPPDCSGQGEGQSFLVSSWASRAVAAAPSFQTCFACVHMYILYACVYICVCMYVCGHVYMYIYACVYVSMRLYTCVCVCVCIFVHRLWVLVSVLQRVDGVMHAHMSSCAYACVYVCVWVYIYVHFFAVSVTCTLQVF